MKHEVWPDAESVAREAAARIAEEARAAVSARGRFAFAFSGGSTPWRMLERLAGLELPWDRVHVFQVDERAAPEGDPDRNWTRLAAHLLARRTLPDSGLHPMPVERADRAAAAAAYVAELEAVTGSPPVLDLVHLGLGADGHTASLAPGDPVLEVRDRDVAWTARPYQEHLRMTLTYPGLDRARRILWLVTGAAKRPMLERLLAGDPDIPAGRVRADRALLLADRPAAGP